MQQMYLLPYEDLEKDPKAGVKLLYAAVDLLHRLYALEAAKAVKPVFMPQRITIQANSTFLFDVGLVPHVWKISVAPSTDTLTLEIHHGEFAGVTPLEVLGAGDFAQIPAKNSRLLLRNGGSDPITLTVVAETEGGYTIERY